MPQLRAPEADKAYQANKANKANKASVRPFPWRSLEAVTRAEVSALRDVKFWIATHVDLDRLGQVAQEMLGASIAMRIDRVRPTRSSSPLGDGVGVALARAEDPTLERSVLVEAEATLVASVVSRALGQPAPSFVEPGVTPSVAAIGAFAAILIAAFRRSHTGKTLVVLRAGPAQALEADVAQRDPERWCVSSTVLVGDNAFAARLVVPSDAALSQSRVAWDRLALTALGGLPLALPVVRCAPRMTAAALASLRAGDALVLPPAGTKPLSRGVEALAGSVWLAAPSAELGLCAELGEDGRIVLGGKLEPLAGAETDMASDDNALTTALGDVPVVVRVEIGEAVMTARDWASLGRGDVVGLSRRVGGPVLLRVGGVPVARGELVELDGELAVRIVERLAQGGDTEP